MEQPLKCLNRNTSRVLWASHSCLTGYGQADFPKLDIFRSYTRHFTFKKVNILMLQEPRRPTLNLELCKCVTF